MIEVLIVGHEDMVLDIRERAMLATLEYCEELSSDGSFELGDRSSNRALGRSK